MFICTKIFRGIAKVGDFIQSQHYRYWKLFHFHNARRLSELTSSSPMTRLQKSEVETRIFKILHESELADLMDFSFNQDIRKDLNLDSLSITVLISSIEEEFSTVFDQDVYQHCKNLGEVVDILIQDQNIA